MLKESSCQLDQRQTANSTKASQEVQQVILPTYQLSDEGGQVKELDREDGKLKQTAIIKM